MTLNDLDTPALIVDLDVLERNIRTSAQLAARTGKRLRPHIKTHKCIEIARMQIDAGAVGITSAKISEAEVFVDAGIENIFIANQIAGRLKIDRLAALSRRCRLRVGLDSLEGLQQLAEGCTSHSIRIEVLIEVDTFSGRAGVRSPQQAVELAEAAAKTGSLRFAGIFTHEGGVYAETEAERRTAVERAAERMAEVAEAIEQRGLRVEEISTGSTPGAPLMAEIPWVTEIRPGNGIFFDAMQLGCGASADQLALTVLATVVSRPDAHTAIIDAGSKTLSGDRAAQGSRHGLVTDDPDILFDWANEEHGHLDLRGAALRPKVGDRLRIVPWHACTCCNMLDTLNIVRGETVLHRWSVPARGCVT